MTESRLSGRGRIGVAAVAIIVGVGAVFEGWALLSDAESVGAKASWLDGTPFPNYVVPGIVLLVVIGGGMLLTAAAALLHSRYAELVALAMGVTLLMWGAVETIAIGYQGAAQLVLLALFVVGPAILLIMVGSSARGFFLIRRHGC